MKERYTAEQVADALKETKGALYMAAKRLGCSHTTVLNYAKRYAMVREAMERENGEFVDTAELKLRQAVINGESWAILFTLRTKGKDRGYVERQEVTHDFSKMSDEQLRNYIKAGLTELGAGDPRGPETGA